MTLDDDIEMTFTCSNGNCHEFEFSELERGRERRGQN